MRTTDFDFHLPEELIAQFPTQERGGSRLLRLNGKTGELGDEAFAGLPQFLQAGDLLLFNDTRVIKARLEGYKATGGKIEVLIERVLDNQKVLAQVRASKAPRSGSRLLLANAFEAEVISRQDDLFLLHIIGDTPVMELLDTYGAMPLPPYINHEAGSVDEERYQTVYARSLGAVAAPTAGLHFDTAMLKLLQQHGIELAYVTLHVGAGTFQPVRVDNIAEHKMHSELYSVPESTVASIKAARKRGGKITAVGTTVLRALESAAQSGELLAGYGETSIFITPGYHFNVVERLLTNFHLPKSTLLMLISAFAGMTNVQQAYQHAIAHNYRFFSYGDAMLIERAQ